MNETVVCRSLDNERIPLREREFRAGRDAAALLRSRLALRYVMLRCITLRVALHCIALRYALRARITRRA